jgi:hypothetical protein
MSIDFNSYLTISGKDHRAVEEVTGDVLAEEDGDTFEYDLCERCYWALKDFIQKGLRKLHLPQDRRRRLSHNNSDGFKSSSLAA